jgi:ferric-dicitrate binding protein FerR (iron transport regulator)
MDHHYLVREIILKYHRGVPLTAEEQAILNAEMANLPAEKVWERIRSHVESQRGRVVVMRPWYVRWPAVMAGAAAMVILVAGGLYRYRAHSESTLAVRVAGLDGVVVVDSAASGRSEPYQVSLPDGSAVTLSYGSSIRYEKTFEQRKVILVGQAYFDVANREDPFIVESGNTTVEVLGTKFNWMHYPGVPDEITLLSGKIQLSRSDFQRVLAPGEQVTIREGSPTLVKVETMKAPEESVAWMRTRPAIVFDSTDLYTVIERMAQYYQVGFFVDPGLRTGKLINGSMNLQWSLEENLAPIREMLKDDAWVDVKNGMIEVKLK